MYTYTPERKSKIEKVIKAFEPYILQSGTVKYYAQIHLQFWQNSVCTGQGRLAIRKCIKSERVMNGGLV